MQAGGIQDQHLRVFNRVIAHEAVARRLRLVADAGQFGADQGVEEGAFAGVGPTVKGNVTAVFCHEPSILLW